MTTRRALLRKSLAIAGMLTSASIMPACAPPATPTPAPTKPAEQPTAAPAQKPAAEKKAVELIYWNDLTGPDGEVYGKILKRYNDGPGKDAGVSVKTEIIEGNVLYTKAIAAYAAGQPIDIIRGGADNAAVMLDKGMLLPLDDIMSGAGLDWNDFYPAPVKSFTFRGKRYGVPQEVSNYTTFYNVDQAQAAGLDVKNFPKDKDGLVAWAKAVTKVKDGKFQVAGLVIPGNGSLAYRWWFQGLYQNEGALLTDDSTKAAFNTDAGKAACQFLLDCWDTYKIADREMADARKAFTGKYGSIIQDGSWMGPSFAKTEGLTLNTALLPIYGKKLAGFAITTAGLVFKHDTETAGRTQAIGHFLKWFADDPAWILDVPTVPVRKSHGQMDKVRQIPYLAPFIDMVPYGVEAPPIAKYGEVSKGIIDVLDKVWSKETPVAVGLSTAETQVNQILAR
jgi:multiple sugar transport system substrate-binding protein